MTLNRPPTYTTPSAIETARTQPSVHQKSLRTFWACAGGGATTSATVSATTEKRLGRGIANGTRMKPSVLPDARAVARSNPPGAADASHDDSECGPLFRPIFIGDERGEGDGPARGPASTVGQTDPGSVHLKSFR